MSIILFSIPSQEILEKITPFLFPNNLKNKKAALMLAEGSSPKEQQYFPFWKEFFNQNKIDSYEIIDNSKIGQDAIHEKEKIKQANILIICGGNTFSLMNNLRKSGLDKEIIKMAHKDNIVIAGFSAGAIALTPDISLASSPFADSQGDINKVGLTNMRGLNIVNFEVYPHYTDTNKNYLMAYKSQTKNEVHTIKDNEFIVI